MKKTIVWALAALFGLGTMTAEAADVSLSGFGTLGYAQSNQPYHYLRFINNSGTVKRDSVAGVQADVKFTDSFGASIQGKFAPSTKNESSWDSTLSWAFISWRPSNDWLFRLGKQRVPLYLDSENLDVGLTYDFAHMPSEMYNLTAIPDYDGVSLSKNWNLSFGELTLDGYNGRSKADWRTYQRDNVQLPPPAPSAPQGASFTHLNIDTNGIALTLLRDEDKYRVSRHKITIAPDPGQFFVAYDSLVPATAFLPGVEQSLGLASGSLAGTLSGSAYTVLPEALITSVDLTVYTLGADIHLPKDFRLVGEYCRRKINNQVNGIDTNGGYFALLKAIDRWTPYVSYGRIKSRADILSNYQAANANTNGVAALAPGLAPVAAVINASQRVVADNLFAYDQHTIALGTSYRLSPTQKIKFEWARTHVGVSSNLVDAPAGDTVSNRNINVLSFSYNVVF